jgi:hypothetical protein
MDITCTPEPIPPQYQNNFFHLCMLGIVLGPVIGVPLGLLFNYDQFVFWGLGIGFVSFCLCIPCCAARPWYQKAFEAGDLRVPARFQFMVGLDHYDTQTSDLVAFHWTDVYPRPEASAVFVSRVKRRPFMINWNGNLEEGQSQGWPGPFCHFFSSESELVGTVWDSFGPVGLERLAGLLVSVAGEDPHYIQAQIKDA